MLYKKIDESEINFCELFFDPIAMTECLIPDNFKAPHIWAEEDCKLITLRPYQFAWIDYSNMYADDDTLSDKENFRRKIGAGNIINLAARDLGKSFLSIIDAFLTLIYGEADESCVSSFDHQHMKKICSPIANFANTHPFFNIFRKPGKECTRFVSGGMEIDTALGHIMYGRNENVNSPDPGTSYHSLHWKKFIYEEASYISDEGAKKRVDSESSIGAIERLNGIPDVRIGSYIGRLLNDEAKQPWICNLPQFVRESWDDITKAKKIQEYGGSESTPMYRLNVLGEAIEGAKSLFIMERIKDKAYSTKRHIKTFEISPDNYNDYQSKIILDSQPSELTIIASDIGTTGSPSEVCIYFGDNKLMKWRYNISLYQLTTQEQAKIFKWIFEKLSNPIIAIDATSDGGRSICDELEILGVPKNRIVRVMFNTKMVVGFETSEDGIVQRDNKGDPIYKLERTIDWACLQLENLFYNGLIEIPHSEKFLREFSSYFAVTTGTTKRYGSTTTDHLVQSFQVMSIARFQYEFSFQQQLKKETSFLGGF